MVFISGTDFFNIKNIISRYSLVRKYDGVTEVLTSDKFTFTNGNGSLQIKNGIRITKIGGQNLPLEIEFDNLFLI